MPVELVVAGDVQHRTSASPATGPLHPARPGGDVARQDDDIRFDVARLEAFLCEKAPGFVGPASVSQFKGGQSNPTYLIEAASGRYVLRRKPPGKLLKSAHMIEREFRVLRALDGTGFPAPRALALCEDEGVIGTAFYVMAYVEGRVFWDPAVPEAPRSERMAVYDAMLSLIHI